MWVVRRWVEVDLGFPPHGLYICVRSSRSWEGEGGSDAKRLRDRMGWGVLVPSQDLSSYYQRVAPRYNSLRLDSDIEVQSTAEWILASTQVSGPVLEIGCGTGRHGACMAASGREVWSIDRNLAQLLQAPASLRRILADASSLPIRDRVAAVCAFVMVVHQFSKENLKAAISETGRVLRVDGTLFVKTASRQDLRERPLAEFFPSALELNVRRYPSIDELLSLIVPLGFSVPSLREHSRISN